MGRAPHELWQQLELRLPELRRAGLSSSGLGCLILLMYRLRRVGRASSEVGLGSQRLDDLGYQWSRRWDSLFLVHED